jgi:peptide deformylase
MPTMPTTETRHPARTLIYFGDPLLSRKSIIVPDINGDIVKLAREMLQVMEEAKGIGLAAVQVGELVRLFVTRAPRDAPRVFINPDILETSIEQVSIEEGCLSVPGINVDVVRPEQVRVQAWNEKGRPFTLTAEGMLARVIQHEYDHLNGVMFFDRVDAKKRKRLITAWEELQKG